MSKSKSRKPKSGRTPNKAERDSINKIREALRQPSGMHSDDEKAAFTGHCVLDVVAAASMLEQISKGDEPTVPKGIKLPDGYMDDLDAIDAAFDTLTKSVKRVNKQDIQYLGCVTCCNTMKINLDTGDIDGRENGCQKYHEIPVDFRE